MNRRSLGALAIVIILLMVIVATAGLDNLPRDLRASVANAAAKVEKDRALLEQDAQFVQRALRDEPALFRTKTADYASRLNRDNGCIAAAVSETAALQQFAKVNHRADADKVRAGLGKIDSRNLCVQDVAGMRAEAERWLNYKRQLPSRLQSMAASYEAVRGFDVDAAAAAVSKAMADWPAKREDLQARLDRLKASKQQADQAWDSSASLRAAAAKGNTGDFDYAALFQSADRIDQVRNELGDGAKNLNELAGQLYIAWDKLLLDVDEGHNPPAKVRLVRTKFADASLTNGQTSSEERWENATASMKKAGDNTGMVVERKAAGKYDFEAERVVEPPAYARVAPPGQSNQYGSWQNGVWHWLPQYLILRELLSANRGPISTGDWSAYDQARRRGEVFYGRNDEFRWRHSPRSTGGVLDRVRDWARSRESAGTGGGFYKERPKTYGSSGYGGSKYQSRGGYSGSRYQSRGGFGSFGSRSYSRGFGGGRSFGGRR